MKNFIPEKQKYQQKKRKQSYEALTCKLRTDSGRSLKESSQHPKIPFCKLKKKTHKKCTHNKTKIKIA